MLLHTLLMAAGTQQQGPDGLFFIGGTTDFTDQGTFTSSKTTTGLSIGTPFPDRKIIAAAKLATTFHGGGGNAAFDSLTLDGTAMTLVATAKAASAEDIVGIFQMHKENGTSADFVMSCKNSSTGSALNYHSGGLAIYTTYGKATSAHDTETVNSSTSPLDAEINAAFNNTEATEQRALDIESRIKKIPSAASLLPKRRYGTPVNGESFGLTLSSLVESKDPELGAFLGLSTGYWKRKQAEEEAQKIANEAMMKQTEELRTKNLSDAHLRQQRVMRGFNPVTGAKII